MENKHVVTNHAVFWLAPINDHRAFVIYCWVVFSYPNGNAFSLENVNAQVVAIVLDNLVGAFSYLALSVEHEATAKNDYFALVVNSRMALSPLDDF